MFNRWLKIIEDRISDISESKDKPGLFSLEWFLVGGSSIYGLCVWFWHRLYEKGILKQKKLPCCVVSIGNIVVGGAGKTPMTIYVAGLIKKMGKQPVVISRGYKGNYKKECIIVSDGNRIFSNARESGDEPYMMAQRRDFPVVVGKDRFKAGVEAIKAFNPDVIVLDDGFQHLKLKRDLDLLLLDHSDPLGNRRVFPAGRLRETPYNSAKRADAIIFTRSPEKDELSESVREVLGYYPGCPWFTTVHKPFVFKQMGKSQDLKKGIKDICELKGKKAVLFSGIAKNASFYGAMKALGVNVLDHLEFKDHYRYKESDILMINQAAKKDGAEVILTTEKDWAKLGPDIKWVLDMIVIGVQIEFQSPQKFEALLNSRLKNYE